ncbi:hypothetical protein O6H91_09G038000 [Diphasiastrum complanatum]|uniref:Uncharacterized protein n=3 Tax=Diphasiastrum complanatum TaxID=34168 RepID=A0ACC2CNE9_DIPCM|nr:hypothetical protein O6H91_09G038000 [Diphasiastrum complanatum]KAJ7543429.1 hypothetical protein O6H91_09G038000 [Diphasiastrum complanatum]KAJ7543430.1 hypothetical protein O6H91_09G038000 [Diphasiastrum complanatum]
MAPASLQRSGSSLSRSPSIGSPSMLQRHYRDRSSSIRYDREGGLMPNGLHNEAEAAARVAFEEFSKDSVFSKFLSEDFNATLFASDALKNGSATASSEKLEEGIKLLEKQLRSEVFLRQDDLLQQLSSLKDTEGTLTVVRAGVESLQTLVQRVRSEIADPYKQIKLKSRQLSSLHETIELIRSVIRTLKQMKRLRELMDSGGIKADLSKAAQLFSEVETLRKESDLSGIEIIDSEVPWLTEAGNRIRAEAMKGLEKGMESLNQAEVGTALQVYYNMGELKSTVEQIFSKYKSQVSKCIAAALDMKAISASVGASLGPGGIQRSGTPQLGGGSRAREGLWQRMGVCMDQLHSIIVAVWHLQRVLFKKRDPISHVVFLDEVVQNDDPMLTERVWEALVKSFASQMKSALTASSFVKETFVLSYPKLLAMVTGLLERIIRDTDVKGVLPAIKVEDGDHLIAALEPFQTAYLAQVLNRLSELVHAMFPVAIRGSIPSQEQISKLIVRIQEEIETVKQNGRLTLYVVREIGKILQLLAEKSEYQVSTGPDSRQVGGPATSLQIKNFTLCLYLQEVHQKVTSILSSYPQAAAEVLSPSLGAIYGVAVDTVTPIFKAMIEKLESSTLQLHDQDFGSDEMAYDIESKSSKYLEEVQRAIMHFRSEFLSKLLPTSQSAYASGAGESICARLARKMASRVLFFFVRHAALVRPLSEIGKLQLARDMAELELVVGQHLFPVEQLGSPYRALRAFRPFIFLETSQIANSPLLQELPISVIFHHLYSRAPEELESPMKRLKLTPLQYSLWLDSQGDEQVWKGVKATLDDYAARVRARGDKEFSPIYPLMIQLGSSLVEAGQQQKL